MYAVAHNDGFALIGKIRPSGFDNIRIFPANNGEYTHDLFQIACDPVDGNSVSFRDVARVCRYCGSEDFACGLSKPLYTVEVDTFDVSYDSWNSKTTEEKKLLVFNALTTIQDRNIST